MFDVAIRLNLKKIEAVCLSFIVRSGVVIFGTVGFHGLSEKALVKILSDERLNVSRELEVLLALVSWARNSAFLAGTKLDDEGLFQKISPRLLKCIRKSLVNEEERGLISDSLAKLIFPKKEEPEKVVVGEEEEEGEPEKDIKSEGESDDYVEEKDVAEGQSRTPSTEVCLLGYFGNILLRRPDQSVEWEDLGTALTLALKFSATMPIFLGGFLAVYVSDKPAKMHIVVKDTKKGTETTFTLKAKSCQHTMRNQDMSFQYGNCTCFEPSRPLIILPGQLVSVFFKMIGHKTNQAPAMTFSTAVFHTDEEPVIQLCIDKIYFVRKLYFMSASGTGSAGIFSN